MSRLLALPNELAFLIFDDLDRASLLTLAKSCSHLNIIVISYYLSCHHILNPDVLINLNNHTFHALPFLWISTLLTSSQNLASFVGHTYWLREIRGLKGLVDKLSSVRTVSLSLSRSTPFDADHEVELRFVEDLHSLLTTIIARSCESLSIGGGPKLSYGFALPSAKINIRDFRSPDTLPASKLRWLHIDSGTFFDGLFGHWTVNLINASPITNLTLVNYTWGTSKWDNLLSAIHANTLSEFSIRGDSGQLEFTSLAAFLARHHTITSFECQGFSRKDPEYTTFFLPRLTRLISNYEYLVYLLEDFTVFPSLRNISLDASRSKPPYQFDPYIMKDALKCVKRCPREVELSLRFGRENQFLFEWLDVDVNDNSQVERFLHPVIRLELLVSEFSAATLSLLPKWLGLFPALRLLTFQSYPRSEMVLHNFACSVIQACSQLETLTINEETHAVTTWLAIED